MWPVRPRGCRCGICWAARTCFPRPYGCCGRDPAGSWSPVSKASPGGGTWGRGQSGSLVFLSPLQRRQHELQAAGLCPQARGLPECRGRELVEGKEAGGGKGLRLSSAACCCREASGVSAQESGCGAPSGPVPGEPPNQGCWCIPQPVSHEETSTVFSLPQAGAPGCVHPPPAREAGVSRVLPAMLCPTSLPVTQVAWPFTYSSCRLLPG